MSGSSGASLCRDLSFNPENIFALRDRAIGVHAAENCAAAANLSVIDDDKTPKRRNPVVIVDHQGRARLNCQPSDFVALELLTLLLRRFKRRRIHHLIDRNDFALHVLSRQAQIVEMTGAHWLAHNPENVGVNSVRFDRRFSLMRRNVSALDKDLLAQRDPD